MDFTSLVYTSLAGLVAVFFLIYIVRRAFAAPPPKPVKQEPSSSASHNSPRSSRAYQATPQPSQDNGKFRVDRARIESLAQHSEQRHVNFIQQPIEAYLNTVPGIGPESIKDLRGADVTNTWQLIGVFLSFNRDIDQFLDWLQKFPAIKQSRKAETITQSIATKVALMCGDW